MKWDRLRIAYLTIAVSLTLLSLSFLLPGPEYIFELPAKYSNISQKSMAYFLESSDFNIVYDSDAEALKLHNSAGSTVSISMSEKTAALIFNDWIKLETRGSETRYRAADYCKYMRITVTLNNPLTNQIDTRPDAKNTIENRQVGWRCFRELVN